MGGTREVSIISHRPVTRSGLKQERLVFRGSVSTFFATGCSERYFWRGHHKTLPLNWLGNVQKKRTKVVLRARWLVVVRVVRKRWGTAHSCNTRHALFKYPTSFFL